MHLLYKPTDVDTAYAEWGANCGPTSLAAIAGAELSAIRPHLGDFERRGYMNPTHMTEACRSVGLDISGVKHAFPTPSQCGLVFVQWGGSWLQPGVPIGAAYRRTHWIAVAGNAVYDVNVGHWVARDDWTNPADGVAVEIMRQVKGCDGTWSVRNALITTVGAIVALRTLRGWLAETAVKS